VTGAVRAKWFDFGRGSGPEHFSLYLVVPHRIATPNGTSQHGAEKTREGMSYFCEIES
jgi:hypothetical protein